MASTFTLTKLTDSVSIIAALHDNPNADDGLSATELKQKFDEAANIIKSYVNNTLTVQAQAEFRSLEDALENYTVPDGSITAAKIASSAVTSGKILSSAVTTAKINASAVTTAKIADGNVTRAKLATDALYSPYTENKSSNFFIIADDIGKTYYIATTGITASFETLNDYKALPKGAEFAFIVMVTSSNVNFQLELPSGVTGKCIVDGVTKNVTTAKVNNGYTPIVLKKVTDSVAIVSGLVEVVEVPS